MPLGVEGVGLELGWTGGRLAPRRTSTVEELQLGLGGVMFEAAGMFSVAGGGFRHCGDIVIGGVAAWVETGVCTRF